MGDVDRAAHSGVIRRTVGAAPADDLGLLDSFAAFYARSYSASVRLAYGLVDRRELAEEIAQDAYAALYDRFDRVADPLAYVRRSIVNGCRRVHRRRALALRRMTPARDAVTDLGYNHLLEAVWRLPARQRAVVVLHYEAGLTVAEIAATLAIPAGSVKSALSRARDRLRKEIEP